jgi:hypothetical protein
MPPPKQRPAWPSDDQVRELDREDEFAGDGRKLQDCEHVGGMAPDADPDCEPERPRPSPARR